MTSLILKYLVLACGFQLIASSKLSSIETVYQKGVDAYSGERWSECIVQFEEALHLYKLYKSIINNCRHECSTKKYETKIRHNNEDLKVYERFFNQRDCIMKCHQKNFEKAYLKNDVSDFIIFNMNARKPYEYLHMCYYQMYLLPKAASAAYTFLVNNPENEQMKQNLKYYIAQPEVDYNEVVDHENEDYKVLLQLGLNTYKQNKWLQTLGAMEGVLADYMAWENTCRSECDRQPEQEWSPEVVITVSNNLAALLQCRQQCQDKLKALEFDSGTDFISYLLNYIQISNYHLERYKEAAIAVESSLLLVPDNEDMLENRKIYSTLTDEESFVGRSDIVFYKNRDDNEKYLLNLFHQGNSNSDFESNIIE